MSRPSLERRLKLLEQREESRRVRGIIVAPDTCPPGRWDALVAEQLRLVGHPDDVLKNERGESTADRMC